MTDKRLRNIVRAMLTGPCEMYTHRSPRIKASEALEVSLMGLSINRGPQGRGEEPHYCPNDYDDFERRAREMGLWPQEGASNG